MPYPNFENTAKVLDYRRLGKQRIEAKQILRVLIGELNGYKNHPAVRMWRGYEKCLAYYGRVICAEWVRRGYVDNTLTFFNNYLRVRASLNTSFEKEEGPEWLGDEQLHSSHRAALLAKDYNWYSAFGWTEQPNVSYYWPKQ